MSEPFANVIASEDGFAAELALESPALFQRFVCNVVARTLIESDVGASGPSAGTGAVPCPPPGR